MVRNLDRSVTLTEEEFEAYKNICISHRNLEHVNRRLLISKEPCVSHVDALIHRAKLVCHAAEVSWEEINHRTPKGKLKRKGKVVAQRQAVYTLMYLTTATGVKPSYPELAAVFGHQNHTAVMQSVKRPRTAIANYIIEKVIKDSDLFSPKAIEELATL